MFLCMLLVTLSFTFSACQLPDFGAPDSTSDITEFTPDDSVAGRVDTFPDNEAATPLVIDTLSSTTPTVTTPTTATTTSVTTTRKPHTNVYSNVQPRQFYYNYPNPNFVRPFQFPMFNPHTNSWSNPQPRQPIQQSNSQYIRSTLPWWMLMET